MRRFLLAAAVLALFAPGAIAKAPSCTAQWNAMSDTDKKATARKTFMAGCKDAATPASAAAQPAIVSTKTAKPLSCTAQWNAMSDTDKKATTRKTFMAGCKGSPETATGGTQPAAAMVPAKAAKPLSCTAQWNAMADTDKKATTRKAFMAGCKDSNETGSATAVTPAVTPKPPKMATPATPSMAPTQPAMKSSAPSTMAPSKPAQPAMAPAKPATAPVTPSGTAPEGANGVCKDGSYTKAKNHSGACSHHGGVAKWL